jgi:hypothetical protein
MSSTPPTRTAGLFCMAGAALGAAGALAMLLWPPQVSAAHFSYPFEAAQRRMVLIRRNSDSSRVVVPAAR